MHKSEMLDLRLQGHTYEAIAQKAGITRQRVQQLISPPREIRDFLIKKYRGRCAHCGILVGKSGHIHHKNNDEENYQDINNLELLCISCHRIRHNSMSYKLAQKRKRNERIREYASKHPNMTQQAIANIFHVSQARVSRILNKRDGHQDIMSGE